MCILPKLFGDLSQIKERLRARGGRFLKKAPQKLLIRALADVCANMVHPMGYRYVRTNYHKGADQKFFAELFFKKATSRARRRNKQRKEKYYG